MHDRYPHKYIGCNIGHLLGATDGALHHPYFTRMDSTVTARGRGHNVRHSIPREFVGEFPGRVHS